MRGAGHRREPSEPASVTPGTCSARCADPVHGYLRASGAQKCDDLLGDVFVDVAPKLGPLRQRGSKSTLRRFRVFTITHNRLVDEHRQVEHKR